MRAVGLLLPLSLLVACSSSKDPAKATGAEAENQPAPQTASEASPPPEAATAGTKPDAATSTDLKPDAPTGKVEAQELPKPTEPPPCVELLTSAQLAAACPVADLELKEFPNPKAEGYYCMLKAHTDQKAGDYVSMLATAAAPSATDSEALKVKSTDFKPSGKTQLVAFTQGGTSYTLQELANSGKLVCDQAKLSELMESLRPRVP